MNGGFTGMVRKVLSIWWVMFWAWKSANTIISHTAAIMCIGFQFWLVSFLNPPPPPHNWSQFGNTQLPLTLGRARSRSPRSWILVHCISLKTSPIHKICGKYRPLMHLVLTLVFQNRFPSVQAVIPFILMLLLSLALSEESLTLLGVLLCCVFRLTIPWMLWLVSKRNWTTTNYERIKPCKRQKRSPLNNFRLKV